MVGLNPVLKCLMTVEEGISRGDAVRESLTRWLANENSSGGLGSRFNREFQSEVLLFLRSTEVSEDAKGANQIESDYKTIYRRSFFGILRDGLRGNPVSPQLKELRIEIESQLELDMKSHIESLPLKMLVPLLLAMFPAFLILLLGPITRNFVEALR